jgi:Ca2+-binding EF-hand superfamily protein
MEALELIDDDSGDFIPKCEQALREIFSRFDKDGDSCLNEEELDNFAIACNGKPFDSTAKEELKDAFEFAFLVLISH